LNTLRVLDFFAFVHLTIFEQAANFEFFNNQIARRRPPALKPKDVDSAKTVRNTGTIIPPSRLRQGTHSVEKFAVLVIGRGKLATELLGALQSPAISTVLPWTERDTAKSERCIVVHAGSGRELPDAARFCSASGSTLFDLATEGSGLPGAPDFPVIICPNVNMLMLCFMAMVKGAAGYFRGRDIRITESHQASKVTKPGTAIHLARSLGFPEDAIRSERDPKTQSEKMGIPPEYLDRHAFHEIIISDPEVEIRLQTRVLGKSAYASGLARLIELVSKERPGPGYHDVVDLIMNDYQTRHL
jgi:4-hydroxy-tetrahydrodipicolinate reductase